MTEDRDTQIDLAFAIDLIAYLRAGGTYTLRFDTPEGRIRSSSTAFRIATHRSGLDHELQIQTSVTDRRGTGHTSAWTWCTWTLAELASLVDDRDCADPLPSAGAENDDPAIEFLRTLSRSREASWNGVPFVVTDEGIRARNLDGSLVELDNVHHQVDDLVSIRLSPDQIEAIDDRTWGNSAPRRK